MAWDFIHIIRRQYLGSDHWGEMYIRTLKGGWERLCYSYELPWKEYQSGKLTGKSVISKSRIRIGTYELKARSNGPKGWRLELQNTGHRSHIQIHRAHKSMYIEGCILPVHFDDFKSSKISKGKPVIQSKSVALMNRIKPRYEALKKKSKGNPTLTIAATLPALITVKRDFEYA